MIDVQNDLASEKGRYAEFGYDMGPIRKIIKSLRDLVSYARTIRVPIIYTKITYNEDYSDGSPFTVSRTLQALKRNSWGSEILEEIAPQEGDYVVDRQRASAFYKTELEEILGSLKVNSLILTGLTASFAVESTGRDAADRDFEVSMVEDCIASFNQRAYRAWLFIGKQKQFWLWRIVTSGEVRHNLS